MCGISGFISKNNSSRSHKDILDRMMDRIAHRGPDGAGHWEGAHRDWRIVLGHRRLSIIDLDSGQQPMSNEDGAIQITFNGEIYNFKELRDQLIEAGHHFRTKSDTEAIIHHFEENGEEGFRDLNGMFAFALWDQRTGRLTLARDRAGIKPLYYAILPSGGIAFASELSAVLAHPEVTRELDVEGLRAYFFSDAIHAPATMLKSIRKLEPGHFIIWKDGQVVEHKAYWTFEEITPLKSGASESDLVNELEGRLEKAVQRQMISDVPLGMFLSGGIDSSLIAALASRHTSGPLRTFSIAFEEPTYDESKFARKVAKHIGSSHTEEVLSESTMLGLLGEALDSLDEPMADPSLLPTWFLSRLTARSVKVALGGDGGDELWGGYPTYRAHNMAGIYGRVPGALRNLISSAISKLPTQERYQSLEWKLKRFTARWDSEPSIRHLRWMSNTDLADLESLLHSYTDLTRLPKPPAGFGSDPMNALLALDFTTYMTDSVLTKVDRASMAHGLEVRPPMLDHEFVSWCFSLPSKYKVRGYGSDSGKYLLKRAAEKLLPHEIAHRPKKGFGIPLASWLRGPLRPRLESVLASSPIWELGVINQNVFADWAKNHFEKREDRSKPLWALIVLDHWMRKERVIEISRDAA